MENKEIIPMEYIDKETFDFIVASMCKVAENYNFDEETIRKISPSISFVDYTNYGKAIKEIDPDAEYTDDENYRGFGKTLHKNGRNYVVIDFCIIKVLIDSGYKNVLCKHLIYHEIGHCISNTLNPKLTPPEKSKLPLPIITVSKYLFSVAINEYMANNYIIFLLTSDECDLLLENTSLYNDIENCYENIRDPFDLFNHFWNGPNAIFINLIANIPLFEKSGGFKDVDILEIINIKSIKLFLEKEEKQLDIIYNHLVHAFNLIVKDYNSDNPSIIQKSIPAETKQVDAIEMTV